MVKIITEKKILFVFMLSIVYTLLLIPSTNLTIYSKTKQSNDIGTTTTKDTQPRVTVDTPTAETSNINLPVTLRKDTSGDLQIIGEVINKGTETAKFMKIIATVYNSQNQTIGTEYTFTDPNSIEPGQSAPFKMTLGSFDNIPVAEIDHIKLHLDWRDSNHTGL
jgi:hypothetical protein